MLPNIKNLREISRRCQTGQPLDPDLAVWLGSSLDKFLEQRCHSVDEALGLRFAQGSGGFQQYDGLITGLPGVQRLRPSRFCRL